MRALRRFLFGAVLVSVVGGLLSPRLAFAARGGSSGVINQSLSGTVLRTTGGSVLSVSFIATVAGGEVAIYNWNAASPPASSVSWEGRVASANGSYNHTFQTPLICSEGIVVDVQGGKAFLEFE